MVNVTLSGSPSEFSKELKDQLSKNCEVIFRYIFDEIIPNIKHVVDIEFDYRDMGDKKDYFSRYGDDFYMTLHPKAKCSRYGYFKLRKHFGCKNYSPSIFKKFNIKIDEDKYCEDFWKEYGMQLQLMCHWPTVKKQLLAALEADKKLTADIQNSIKSFEL